MLTLSLRDGPRERWGGGGVSLGVLGVYVVLGITAGGII